jgi:hypothetical protein
MILEKKINENDKHKTSCNGVKFDLNFVLCTTLFQAEKRCWVWWWIPGAYGLLWWLFGGEGRLTEERGCDIGDWFHFFLIWKGRKGLWWERNQIKTREIKEKTRKSHQKSLLSDWWEKQCKKQKMCSTNKGWKTQEIDI